ncbi:MAG: TVP38/TMEM64 family protein [Alphaproteobacteria bacterium]|nr:TVP38/TMEM64 family protein [Alphaproteobacteria bacterium]
MRFQLYRRGLILIVTLAAVGFLVEASGLRHALDQSWIDERVRDHGLAGTVLFIASGTLLTGVGLPRQVLCFLGGYAFGFVEGTALSLVSTLFGCVGTFYGARWLGRDFVAARFPGKIRRIDDFLHDNPLSMTLLLRLLPLGSNALTNLVAGVSAVGAIGFLTGSALGYLPQTAVFALLGSGIQIDPVLRISISVALFFASAGLGMWLYRRFRHGRSVDAEIDEVDLAPIDEVDIAPSDEVDIAP